MHVASRRVVTMVWIERVRSLRYQAANVVARATAKKMVLDTSETPK